MPTTSTSPAGYPVLSPLVVDLDQSLIRVALSSEAVARLGLRSPWLLIVLAWHHRHSLAAFKTAVAEHVSIDPGSLPYDDQVVSHLRAESAKGRRLILASASPLTWTKDIAEHLGIFSDVVATDERVDLKNQKKLDAVRNLIHDSPFSYIGDSKDDIPLFEAAEEGRLLVGSSKRVMAQLRKKGVPFTRISPDHHSAGFREILRSCRPVHWAKNLLIFLPAVTSWGTYDPRRLVSAALTFLAFSLTASAIYQVNDLADIATDRNHPDKRHRPVASGDLPVSRASLLAAGLALLGLVTAATIDRTVLAALLIYLTLNIGYTSRLKEIPLADITLLCVFYLMRVMLGLFVLGLPQSIWFLAFLGCLFAHMAHWKRYVEVAGPAASSNHKRRSYGAADANVLLAFGVGFSFSAAIILILYLRSNEVSPVYMSPGLLTLLAPLLLLHNLGMWLDASRGHCSSDPVTFVLHSRKFWCIVAAATLVVLAARLLH